MGRDELWKLRLLNHPKYRGPIAGADPEGDDEGGGSDDGGGDGDGDGDGDEGLSEAEKLKAENQRLKRQQAEYAKSQRKAEREAAKKAEQDKEKNGQYQQLAEERAQTIAELQTEIDDLKREAVEGEHRRSLESIADELGFKRPRRVWAILQDELGDGFDETVGDETLLKNELRKLARSEPELVDQQRRSGAPGGGARQRGQKADPAREHNELVASLFGAPQ